jgi:hypothetical protein
MNAKLLRPSLAANSHRMDHLKMHYNISHLTVASLCEFHNNLSIKNAAVQFVSQWETRIKWDGWWDRDADIYCDNFTIIFLHQKTCRMCAKYTLQLFIFSSRVQYKNHSDSYFIMKYSSFHFAFARKAQFAMWSMRKSKLFYFILFYFKDAVIHKLL